MRLKGFFPEEYRAFCNGPLSVCVERFGGVNSIGLLDCRASGGKVYPDRNAVSIFSRQGQSCGRPLMSPAITFLKEDKDGLVRNYCPEDAELFPFGFRSRSYEMRLGHDALGFRFLDGREGRLIMSVSTAHFLAGRRPSLKNHVLWSYAAHSRLSAEDLRNEGLDPDFPFPENGVEVVVEDPFFDAGQNELVIRLNLKYADHEKTLFTVITANAPLNAEYRKTRWLLSAECPRGGDVTVAFGFAGDRGEASSRAGGELRSYSENWRKAVGGGARKKAPRLRISSLPLAAEFMREFSSYQHAMLLAEGDRETSIRAAADKYGFFAMWDHVYPTRDFLLLGRPDIAAKAIRYMLDYPHVKVYTWLSAHLIITLNEYLAFTGDTRLRREAMPFLREYFAHASVSCDAKTGLVKTRYSCGNDNSLESGFDSFFFASCVNGWWYDACRALENLAREEGDHVLAGRCLDASRKMEERYHEMFFDPATGYLRQAVAVDGSRSADIFQNTNTLGLDYMHGRYLFRKTAPSLAAYQARKLYHRAGRLSVSHDSAISCDMWRSVHMNQHLGHECKLARLGGFPEEARRLMSEYLRCFDQYKNAIETFNFAGCVGNQAQTADWQTFSATGAAQALWHGVAGIDWHRGGICHMPARGNDEVRIENFLFNKHVYDISISGSGPHASLFVDGARVDGTLQVPADLLPRRAKVELRIERKKAAPKRPVLIAAIDAPVTSLRSGPGVLEFQFAADIHAPVEIYSPSRAVASLNGQEIDHEWIPGARRLWLDRFFRRGDSIMVRTIQ